MNSNPTCDTAALNGATIDDLTDERARQPCRYGNVGLSFAELLLYGMRHVQHHVAQLNLLLRQNVDPAPHWVKRATADLRSE